MNIEPIKQQPPELALQRPRRLVSTGVAWSVDLGAGSVLHESGIVICFTRLPARADSAPDPQTTSLDMCWAPGGSPVWALSADTAALLDTLKAFEASDARAAARLLGMLAREAGRAWLAAWAPQSRERSAGAGAFEPCGAGFEPAAVR